MLCVLEEKRWGKKEEKMKGEGRVERKRKEENTLRDIVASDASHVTYICVIERRRTR